MRFQARLMYINKKSQDVLPKNFKKGENPWIISCYVKYMTCSYQLAWKFFKKMCLKNWKKSWKFTNYEHSVQFSTSISTLKSCVYLSGIHSHQYQWKIIYESKVMIILVKVWIYLHLKIKTSWNFWNLI